MDIAAYCNGRIDCDDVALFYQELTCFVAELAYLRFWDGATSAQLGYGSATGQ
jgi:hypothetical protein